jgi:hypothetical protein
MGHHAWGPLVNFRTQMLTGLEGYHCDQDEIQGRHEMKGKATTLCIGLLMGAVITNTVVRSQSVIRGLNPRTRLNWSGLPWKSRLLRE